MGQHGNGKRGWGVKVEIQCQNDFTSCYGVQQMWNNAEKSPHFLTFKIFVFKVEKTTRFR